jgi:hypothetical protein
LLLKSFLVFTGSRGSRLLSGWPAYVAAAAVVGSGALLSLLGFSLMTYLDSLPDLPSRLVYCALAAVCLIISTSCTHGLAGDLLHGDEEGAGWRFFQPGVGGTVRHADATIINLALSPVLTPSCCAYAASAYHDVLMAH